ncbi:MAG: DUF3793 family protein [Lachnospiraceae bacterium]|nr:DUF3793 family protein [Lachnospiraceae bacterium]
MSEELIIEHCSPTLAGIKAGSMFSVRVTEDTDINREVKELNKVLRKKGLRVIPLKKTSKNVLIYLYRPDQLKKDLNDPQALNILKKMGYEPRNPECCIVQLVRHLKSDGAFPHEIGLFLGYPPSDVECFMKHPSKGVKCCGCWKVYSEPEKAQKMFARFRECTQVYHEMNKSGKSLAQLAVMTG